MLQKAQRAASAGRRRGRRRGRDARPRRDRGADRRPRDPAAPQIDYKGRRARGDGPRRGARRRPQVVLVDELAHTNAPGSRHPKRYQDVEELLAAGIDVFTTLNIQHLESLNDIVARITGVQVRETVPDSVLDRGRRDRAGRHHARRADPAPEGGAPPRPAEVEPHRCTRGRSPRPRRDHAGEIEFTSRRQVAGKRAKSTPTGSPG